MPSGWIDADQDCQDTRHEVLIRWARPANEKSEGGLEMSEDGCRVVRGTWWDPYSGTVLTDPDALDVDHLIPLAKAHARGGNKWDRARRVAYANDTSYRWHLVPVLARLNRQKSAKGPDTWVPPNAAIGCQYSQAWATVAVLWALEITEAERASLRALASTC